MENIKLFENIEEVINLTPHAINFVDSANKLIAKIEPTGLARCTMSRNQIGSLAFCSYKGCINIVNVPVNENIYGEVIGLPEPKAGTIYIVSAIVAQAVKGLRDDVFVTDDAVRNEAGQIISCRAFARI